MLLIRYISLWWYLTVLLKVVVFCYFHGLDSVVLCGVAKQFHVVWSESEVKFYFHIMWSISYKFIITGVINVLLIRMKKSQNGVFICMLSEKKVDILNIWKTVNSTNEFHLNPFLFCFIMHFYQDTCFQLNLFRRWHISTETLGNPWKPLEYSREKSE